MRSSDFSSAGAHKMEDEGDDGKKEQQMDESARYVKGEESTAPKEHKENGDN